MPDSSTHAAPEPSPEPDCTCTHITGDAYCPRHGEDAEPCPTPAEMTNDQREQDPSEPDPNEPLDDQARNYAGAGSFIANVQYPSGFFLHDPHADAAEFRRSLADQERRIRALEFPACCRKHDIGGEHELAGGQRGRDLEPTPAEMTNDQREADPTEQDRYGIPTHGPGLPVEPENERPTRVGVTRSAREESSASHPTPEQWEALRRDIAAAINRNSAESWFNDTPDRVLAAFEAAVRREAWAEGYERAKRDHCDYYPSADACTDDSPNPHGEQMQSTVNWASAQPPHETPPADLSGPAPGGN